MQTLIVILIVLVATVYLTKTFKKRAQEGHQCGCAGSCRLCDHEERCN